MFGAWDAGAHADGLLDELFEGFWCVEEFGAEVGVGFGLGVEGVVGGAAGADDFDEEGVLFCLAEVGILGAVVEAVGLFEGGF